MAKLLLIQPPWSVFQGDGLADLPAGLCSLSNYLNNRGHETWVYNADHSQSVAVSVSSVLGRFENYKSHLRGVAHPIWNEIGGHVRRIKPDIVGIHFKTGAIESVRRVATIVRDILPGCLVVVGGPHPSIFPVEVAAMPEFHAAVRGEGEESLHEIAQRVPLQLSESILGVVFKTRDGRIVDGGQRPLLKDVDEACELDRKHLVERQKYEKSAYGLMFSARGCPFECTYCNARAVWTRKVRHRSAESFVVEMERVRREYGTTHFTIRDDTFTLNRKRAIEICAMLQRRLPGITWGCDTRADCIDLELAQAMRRAGCVRACVGLESGSERILSMVKKGETLGEIANGVRFLQRAKISCAVFVMVGFPTEMVHEAEETINFAIGLKPSSITLSIVTPYPGSGLHQQAEQLELLPTTEDFSDYYHSSPRMGLMGLPDDEFAELSHRLANRVAEYNSCLSRRVRQFAMIFAQDPRGAVNIARKYVKRHLRAKQV